MGMFDRIKYEMDCPKCGYKVNSFQSKDAQCLLADLDFWEVDNFYDACGNCGLWIVFNRKNPREKAPISDYEMTTRKKGDETQNK